MKIITRTHQQRTPKMIFIGGWQQHLWHFNSAIYNASGKWFIASSKLWIFKWTSLWVGGHQSPILSIWQGTMLFLWKHFKTPKCKTTALQFVNDKIFASGGMIVLFTLYLASYLLKIKAASIQQASPLSSQVAALIHYQSDSH